MDAARELVYLDLVHVQVPSIFDMTARHMRTGLRFLARFAAEVSQPVAAGDAEIDYGVARQGDGAITLGRPLPHVRPRGCREVSRRGHPGPRAQGTVSAITAFAVR